MTKGINKDDEKVWVRAVNAFKKQYGKEPHTSEDFSIVSDIFQKLGGRFDMNEFANVLNKFKEDNIANNSFMVTKMAGKDEKEIVEPADENKVDAKELEMGIEVELEHTDDREEAKKIALQHLAEVSDYYSKLKTYVEPKMERLNKLYEEIADFRQNKVAMQLYNKKYDELSDGEKVEVDDLLAESANTESKLDYSEVEWKMDKFMPDDEDLLDDFYSLKNKRDKKKLIQLIEDEADLYIMKRYMPKGGTIAGFVDYLVESLSRIDALYESVYKEVNDFNGLVDWIYTQKKNGKTKQQILKMVDDGEADSYVHPDYDYTNKSTVVKAMNKAFDEGLRW